MTRHIITLIIILATVAMIYAVVQVPLNPSGRVDTGEKVRF